MRTFGLIGYPLSHSFSERYFNLKFEKESLENWTYKNFPIQSIAEIQDLLKHETTLYGFNVTSPYKQSVIAYLDEIDELAKSVNSVNVVKINREPKKISLTGYNTDVYGFHKSLTEQLERKINNALILGTGGASGAIAYVLRSLGIAFKFVSRANSRNRNDVLLYSDLDEDIMKRYHLIVNTTPIGMYPNIENKPDLPYTYIGRNHFLFDLIYNPEESLFLQIGKKQGAKISNGYAMLINQAEKGWEIISNV
jgi:shikimate dehydrogenase